MFPARSPGSYDAAHIAAVRLSTNAGTATVSSGYSAGRVALAKPFREGGREGVLSRHASIKLSRHVAANPPELIQHPSLNGAFTALLVLEAKQSRALEDEWIGVGRMWALADHDRRRFVALVHELAAGRFDDPLHRIGRLVKVDRQNPSRAAKRVE